MINTNPLFFEDKPLFGLDIGSGKARVLQLDLGSKNHKHKVIGYGEITFDPAAIKDGVITQPELIAKTIQELFKHHIVGHITTHRVAISLPISRAFTRSVEVPTSLNEKELAEAVQTEAEQYIPGHQDLYVDYTRSASGTDKSNVFIVGMPKRVVDSYVTLTQLLGLETVLMQTSTGAGAHLFSLDGQSDVPSLLVDLGTNSADITVFDNGPVISGTADCGGKQLSKLIMDELKLTPKEADLVKMKYGLSYSKKQKQIIAALSTPLGALTKEIKRSIRYYDEHADGKQTISQIVMMGGGANMPGLTDYLTDVLRIPVRTFDPTVHINFGRLQPFSQRDLTSYVTVAGLATVKPEEVFA